MNELETPLNRTDTDATVLPETDNTVPRWMKIAIAAGLLLALELENAPVVSLPLSTARDFLLR